MLEVIHHSLNSLFFAGVFFILILLLVLFSTLMLYKNHIDAKIVNVIDGHTSNCHRWKHSKRCVSLFVLLWRGNRLLVKAFNVYTTCLGLLCWRILSCSLL